MVRRCFYNVTMVRTTILFCVKLLNYSFGLAYMFVQRDTLIPKLHQLIYGSKLTLTLFCNSSFTILYDFESNSQGFLVNNFPCPPPPWENIKYLPRDVISHGNQDRSTLLMVEIFIKKNWDVK